MDEWEGFDVPRNGRVVNAAFRAAGPKSPATDYDRACDVSDYAGVIDVSDGNGLVLGDEPMSTSWWPAPALRGGMFVRWNCGESDEAVLRHLRDLSDKWFEPTSLVFRVDDPEHCLFDSASPGQRIRQDESIKVMLAMGLYAIDTALYKPDSQTFLVIHKLRVRGPI